MTSGPRAGCLWGPWAAQELWGTRAICARVIPVAASLRSMCLGISEGVDGLLGVNRIRLSGGPCRVTARISFFFSKSHDFFLDLHVSWAVPMIGARISTPKIIVLSCHQFYLGEDLWTTSIWKISLLDVSRCLRFHVAQS